MFASIIIPTQKINLKDAKILLLSNKISKALASKDAKL